MNLARCPYCGLPDEPGTLDHILAKSLYPEYSMFTKNLVPVCEKCNQKKRPRMWNDDGTRRFINPYYDAFMASPFYAIEILPPYQTPLFRVAFPNLSDADRNICESHFKRLQVYSKIANSCAERSRSLCWTFLPEVLDNTLTVAEMRWLVTRLERGERQGGGPNTWDGALYRSIIADDAVAHFVVTVPIGPALPE